MGKSYCARHDRAFEEACLYCEPPAPTQAHVITPPTCTMRSGANSPMCGAPATWSWTPVTPEAIAALARFGNRPQHFCERCHSNCEQYFPGWKKEPLAPPGPILSPVGDGFDGTASRLVCCTAKLLQLPGILCGAPAVAVCRTCYMARCHAHPTAPHASGCSHNPAQQLPPQLPRVMAAMCSCGKYTCTPAWPSWVDYVNGVVHTPMKCAKP